MPKGASAGKAYEVAFVVARKTDAHGQPQSIQHADAAQEIGVKVAATADHDWSNSVSPRTLTPPDSHGDTAYENRLHRAHCSNANARVRQADLSCECCCCC